jgi:hypothetical protein
LKVRFLFILLGPKNPEIDYLELGRCMGTLMTNKVLDFSFEQAEDIVSNEIRFKEFHVKAYKALDRRELVDCITSFTNRSLCIVIPPGEYDIDLLLPVVDWMQKHLKKKKKRATTLQHHRSIVNKTLEKHEKKSAVIVESKESDHESHGEAFKRTGCLFGGLFREMKNRYWKYPSDIRDGFNMTCFISFIFVFTVCFAPALTFGGILGAHVSALRKASQVLFKLCCVFQS